jgi:hypothetical protein
LPTVANGIYTLPRLPEIAVLVRFARFNQALSNELKFSSAVRTKSYLDGGLCDWELPVSPVFKDEAGASLIYYPEKTQAPFLIGLRNELFEVGTANGKTHFMRLPFIGRTPSGLPVELFCRLCGG